MAEILEVSFTTWQDFKEAYATHLYGKELPQQDRYIFRGQGNSDWPLVSSFDRQFDFIKDRLRRHEVGVELVNIYVRLLRAYELDIGIPEGVDDPRKVLPFAQHYGLPTRLLDWTEKVFVAALFAFESHLIKPLHQNIAIWAIDRKHPLWASSRMADFITPPPSGNMRLRNQRGVFTLTYVELQFDNLVDYVRSTDAQGTPLIKFILPASEARNAMIDLDSMGVDSGFLLLDPRGVAGLALLRGLVNYLNTSAPTGGLAETIEGQPEPN